MWLRSTTRRERRVLLAGFLGYGVDGFDFMIYSLAMPTLIAAWGMTRAEAGFVSSAALLTSAIGGWAAGILADRYGRVRVLQWTVVWFAVFTFLCGFTHSYRQLLIVRAVQGLGFGGEWTVGSLLVAETVDAELRGRAAGLVQSSWAVGWAAATVAAWAVYARVSPMMSWKILFWLGLAPAAVALYIRRGVEEPARPLARVDAGAADFLNIFRPPLLGITLRASLLSSGMLGAYYSITTWLPTYLQEERHLSLNGSSGYLLLLIVGSFVGYLSGAHVSDALGRRGTFVLFALGAMLLVLTYLGLHIASVAVMFLGFPLGFFLSGIFSGIGALLAELYPDAARGSGQGFCYNIGRLFGAASPPLIGTLSTHIALGAALSAVTAAAYTLVICAAWALPETRGRQLRKT